MSNCRRMKLYGSKLSNDTTGLPPGISCTSPGMAPETLKWISKLPPFSN